MNKSRLYSIIKSTIVTEKSNNVAKNNTYTFVVERDANKLEIKEAFQTIFGVEVKSVNTLNYMGKTKRTGQRIGRRQDWKKAYVTLREGQSLDLSEGSAE